MRLLEKSFPPEDWQYLSQNATFKERLSYKNETLEDFEEIVKIGSLLLQQRDDFKRGSIDVVFLPDKPHPP